MVVSIFGLCYLKIEFGVYKKGTGGVIWQNQ